MDAQALRRAALREALREGMPKADVVLLAFRFADDPVELARVARQARRAGIGSDEYRRLVAGDEAVLHGAVSAGLGPLEAVGVDTMARLAKLGGGRLVAPLDRVEVD